MLPNKWTGKNPQYWIIL